MFPITAESRISLQNVNINQIKRLWNHQAKTYRAKLKKELNSIFFININFHFLLSDSRQLEHFVLSFFPSLKISANTDKREKNYLSKARRLIINAKQLFKDIRETINYRQKCRKTQQVTRHALVIANEHKCK